MKSIHIQTHLYIHFTGNCKTFLNLRGRWCSICKIPVIIVLFFLVKSTGVASYIILGCSVCKCKIKLLGQSWSTPGFAYKQEWFTESGEIDHSSCCGARSHFCLKQVSPHHLLSQTTTWHVRQSIIYLSIVCLVSCTTAASDFEYHNNVFWDDRFDFITVIISVSSIICVIIWPWNDLCLWSCWVRGLFSAK